MIKHCAIFTRSSGNSLAEVIIATGSTEDIPAECFTEHDDLVIRYTYTLDYALFDISSGGLVTERIFS